MGSYNAGDPEVSGMSFFTRVPILFYANEGLSSWKNLVLNLSVYLDSKFAGRLWMLATGMILGGSDEKRPAA